MQKTNTITVDLISSEIQDKFIKYCDEYSDLQHTERGRESIELSIMFLNGGYYKDGKHQEYTTEEQADKKAEYEKALPAAEIAAEMAAKELLTLPKPEKQLIPIVKNVLKAQLGIEVTDEDLKNKDFGLYIQECYPAKYSLNNKKMQESLSGILIQTGKELGFQSSHQTQSDCETQTNDQGNLSGIVMQAGTESGFQSLLQTQRNDQGIIQQIIDFLVKNFVKMLDSQSASEDKPGYAEQVKAGYAEQTKAGYAEQMKAGYAEQVKAGRQESTKSLSQ